MCIILGQDLSETEKVTPGEYKMKVKLSPFTYTVKVTVQDTTAPSGVAQEALALYGEALTPEMFLAESFDVTGVAASFVAEPDAYRAGYQNIGIQLRDGAGNTTLLETRLCISNLKREYVLETKETYPKKVHFDFFGERADQYPLAVGDVVRLSFDIESREYNGRWFTSIRGWKLDKAVAEAVPPMNDIQPVAINDMPPFPMAADNNDDLPF